MTWNAHERNILSQLASFTMADFAITEAHFFNRHARGDRIPRARQVFVLVATDAGLPKGKVADFMKMDPSFITQVRRRHYDLRTSIEYIHLKGMLSQLVGGLDEVE